MNDVRDKLIIYCDGACSGNQYHQNVGGWGTVIKYDNIHQELSGGELNTSNQRMELLSCIRGLETIIDMESTGKLPGNLSIEVYSDSAYLVNCMKQGWYKRWLVNNWTNSKKNPVENRDLWERLLALKAKMPRLSFIKVKGHAGIELNEKADRLARQGIEAAGKKA